MMLFLHDIPQEWRLFALLQVFGMCLWLAMLGIVHVAKTNEVEPYLLTRDSDGGMDLHDVIPSYFVFVFTPGTMTVGALALNHHILKIPKAPGGDGELLAANSRSNIFRQVGSGLVNFVKEDPAFALAQVLWLTVGSVLAGLTSWYSLESVDRAISGSLLVYFSALVLGFFALGCAGAFSSPDDRPRPQWSTMFISWGLGSALSAGIVISTEDTTYVALVGGTLVFLAGIFLFVEPRVLGPWLGAKLTPAAVLSKDRSTILHWFVVSCLHFLMVSWIVNFSAYCWFGVVS